MTVFLWNKSFL